MQDLPFATPLPPIMRSGLLRVTRMGYDEDGHPFLLLVARYGSIKRLVVYLNTSRPAEWEFYYEVVDPTTGTKTTYAGNHGDPTKDDMRDLDGIPGFD